MKRIWRQAAIGLVFAAAIAACGGDDATDETQSTPQVTSFGQGQFDDLPRYPRSDPFGLLSEKDGVVTRSYRATGVTPEGIIDFYKRALLPAGWTEAEPVHRADTAARGDWVKDDWRLEISAARIEDRRDPDSTEVVVQYSLVLRPR